MAARATKDLDLALVGDEPADSALDVQDLLFDHLASRPTDDAFAFEVQRPSPISADTLGNPGWRVTVVATVGGSHFESLKLDVVARPDEIVGGIEKLVLDPLLPGIAGHDQVVVPAVDVHQHAAEKLHAYSRIYAHGRPSSRVKDLVDLVLLVEAGVLDPARLTVRLLQVYDVRDAARPPVELPLPPDSWIEPYAATAAELGIAASTAEQAWSVVEAEYRRIIPLIDGEPT